MNGWTPQMVFSLPRSMLLELVAMLKEDDGDKGKTGFTHHEGFRDR